MKSVCAATSTRADFGLLLPLLRRLEADEDVELRIAVTGAHLSQEHGMTVSEIESCGLLPDVSIPILDGKDTALSESLAMSRALSGFAEYFEKRRPDMLVILGDRYEMCAVACAAVNARIPIAHLYGGETTEGAIDECYRHAMTKMSYLHFTSCEAYRRRVIQLGEAPERVINAGSLGVDNFLNEKGVSMRELSEYCGIELEKGGYAVVTFHPVTLEGGTEIDQLSALASAMSSLKDMKFLITMANADAGGVAVNEMWRREAALRAGWALVPSLGMKRYVTALKNSACMIGNSSSGLTEAPAAGVPTVNIGDRQKGRIAPKSVISCPPEEESIKKAIEAAMSAPVREAAKRVACPFGDGHAAERMYNAILQALNGAGIDLKKKFFDL